MINCFVLSQGNLFRSAAIHITVKNHVVIPSDVTQKESLIRKELSHMREEQVVKHRWGRI